MPNRRASTVTTRPGQKRTTRPNSRATRPRNARARQLVARLFNRRPKRPWLLTSVSSSECVAPARRPFCALSGTHARALRGLDGLLLGIVGFRAAHAHDVREPARLGEGF